MHIMIKKFHNLPNTVKKSIAEQAKLASWVLGGINGFSMHVLGNIAGIFTTVLWWFAFQSVAHYILYKLDNVDNEE